MNTPNGMERDPRHGPQPWTHPEARSSIETPPAAHESDSGHGGHK